MDTPRISLVIPAWNEADRLPRLLDSIDVARAHWQRNGGATGAIEVIVADNASTDSTAAIALTRGCRVATVEHRAIAASRNGGAALARGEIIAFVDADSVLHADVFLAVSAAMQDGNVVGGSSGVTMERWSAGIALTVAMALPVVWLTGFDTGLVFCRRNDFISLGGYDASRRVAEDVDFMWRLRKLGRERGQHITRLRGVKTVTSTRKFDQHGDWHYFTRMPMVLWQLLRDPRSLGQFAQDYWYGKR
jgi:glycosyltransferase involved in cell wall biosynthesis